VDAGRLGLAAGLGGTIGELSGYLAGFSGQAIVERMDVYYRVKPWVDKYGGWTIPYWHDDIGAYFGATMQDCDTFLLGRKTWQTHGEAFEPNPEGDPFAGFKKYVVSSTLKSADGWRDSTLISSNVIEEIRKLKSQPGKNIIMDGSSVLIHTLIENDLVDEFSLHVYPLVLGIGKRLFPEGKRANLKLIESSSLPTGVVYQRYQPA
jgi:dihydrofolate reductase